VTGATSVNQWDKYGSQISGGLNLVQGQRYYVEVLHKEGNGADHVEVGWQLPSGAREAPIPGNRLIPFEDASTSATQNSPTIVFGAEEDGGVSIYPNPVMNGKQLSIELPANITGEVQVDIVSVTGTSLQNEKLADASGVVVIDLKPAIAPGIYLVKVSNNKKRLSSKIRVR
jgi:hypothetical protein